jgi:hypothetical protein
MPANDEMQKELLEVIGQRCPDLGARYYAFAEARAKRPESKLGKQDFAAALAETGLGFDYDRRESFFVHDDTSGDIRLRFGVTFRHSEAELLFSLTTPRGLAGDPVHGLAYDLEAKRGLAHKPPYPCLPFSNREELREVAVFAVAIFKELRELVLHHDLRHE